jgi:hypothetical protein
MISKTEMRTVHIYFADKNELLLSFRHEMHLYVPPVAFLAGTLGAAFNQSVLKRTWSIAQFPDPVGAWAIFSTLR